MKQIVTLAASFGLLLSGCHKDDKAGASAAGAQRPPASVTAVVAEAKDVPIYLDEIGKTLAVESVTIIPQIGGKVISAHVTDGAYVKKGDLLFEIDPRPFQASLSAAKATQAQAKADLSLAKIEFDRAEGLVQSAAVSQLEYDQKKSAYEVAEAKVLSADAAIETAQLDLEYAKIYSPIDGRAGARLVDPGNVVKENEGPMLVIQRLDPIYAEFTITENELGTVRKFMASNRYSWGDSPEKGLRVLVDIPGDDKRVIAALAPVAGRSNSASSTTQPATTQTSAGTQPTTSPSDAGPREGKLTFLDNAVQNTMGTVKLRATLPNSDRYFWPGQFVNVRLILTTKKDAVVVPVQAQQIGQQGPFVYIVKQDGTADMRPIVVGQRQGDMIVIDQGVQAGENVVVTGQMMVQPGGKVTITNQPAAAPAGASPQASAAR
jgi:multidrug efflux system membrane fusion protein